MMLKVNGSIVSMRRMPKLSRVMSLGLAIALMVSSPMSAYAENEDASAETQIEITSEGEPASDSNIEASALESNAGASEDVVLEGQSGDGASNDSNNEEINNEESKSDDAQAADESGKDDESDAQKVADAASDVIDDVENKTSDDADEETKVGEEQKEESENDADIDDADDEDDDEDLDEEDQDEDEDLEDDEEDLEDDEEEEEEEIEYSYSSNGDGTHVKSWTDEDGEVHEETEDCSYDENGKCTHCGYEFEIEYTYTSNNDGTHIKSWVDAFGEEHSEEEECEYDENGICKYCKFELEDDDEIIELTDANGIVTIRAKKSVLNGAVKVTADEITVESDEDAYNDMADALEEEVGEESSVVDFVAYDINLYDEGGNVVEPTGELRVIFNDLSVDGIDDDSLTTEIYHYDNESVDKVEQVNVENADAVEMTTDHFSTYIVAVKGNNDKLYESQYVSVKSYYFDYNEYKYKTQQWTNKNSLPGISKYGNYYYVSESGRKYNYYPLAIKVYVDGVEKESKQYAVNSANAEQWFRVTVENSDYTLESFKAGYGDSRAEIQPDSDGDYDYTLTNYCRQENYNTSNRKCNHIEVYLKSKTQSNITISDTNLLSDGQLEATLNSSVASQYSDKTIQYRWSKKVGSADYEKCENVTYQGLGNSIDGNKINIVLDEGTLTSDVNSVLYKVEAYYVENDVETVIATSDDYSVAYYNELQNGSFEKPVLAGNLDQYSNENYKSNGGVWQSTGVASNGAAIEIINTEHDNSSTANSYAWYNADGTTTVRAADGVQFAEINCEAEGALYQDVLTIKGTELNYWFSHRARGIKQNSTKEYDTMYVVIMPWSLAESEGLDTQDKLSNYLSSTNLANMSAGDEYSDSSTGIYILKVRDHDQSWTQHVGKYVPTEYATRFYFLAGSTAYDEYISSLPSYQRPREIKWKTVGNFIDRVGFSQKLPPVEENYFDLQIQKTIKGLTSDEVETLRSNLTFKITAVDANGDTVTNAPLNGTEVKASDMTKTTSGDDVILTWTTEQKIDNYSYYYIIEEQNATLTNCILTSSSEIDLGDGTTKQTINSKEYVLLKSKANATFKFVNTYEKQANVSFMKLDEDENAIEGAGFTLYKTYNAEAEDAESMFSDAVGEEVKSDSTGKVEFTDLDAGTYYLVETTIPTDYAKPTESWKLTIESGEAVISAIGEDEATLLGEYTGTVETTTKQYIKNCKEYTKKITIKKTWDGTAASSLSFKVYGKYTDESNKTYYIDSDGNWSEDSETVYATVNMTADDGWEKTITGVPVFYNNDKDVSKVITWSVVEDCPTGYEITVNDDVEYDEDTAVEFTTSTTTVDPSIPSAATTSGGGSYNHIDIEYYGASDANSTGRTVAGIQDKDGNQNQITVIGYYQWSGYYWTIDSKPVSISGNDGDGEYRADDVYTGNNSALAFKVKFSDSSSYQLVVLTNDDTYPSGTYLTKATNLTGKAKEYYDKAYKDLCVYYGLSTNSEQIDLSERNIFEVAKIVCPASSASGKGKLDDDSSHGGSWARGLDFVLTPRTIEENIVTDNTTGDETHSFTNKAKQSYSWELIKVSENDHTAKLAGAEFTLTSQTSQEGETATVYYGKSTTGGLVQWYSDAAYTTELAEVPDGTYELEETVAPNGYTKSLEKWTVTVDKYNAITASGKNLAGTEVNLSTSDQQTSISIEFENAIAYTLPETGGIGVYGYTIGGVLLMMGAMLLLYKNKKQNKKNNF